MIRDTSLCGLGQSAPNSVLTALRHFRHEFEDHIRAKRCRAGVCGDLALAPCENSCPIHMNIPRFLQLYKENRLEDAFESVIMDNPLPASTGRVCQHPCESRCRRQTVDEPINMREVHRVIADSGLRPTVRRDGGEGRAPSGSRRTASDRSGGRGTRRSDRRVLPGAAGPRRCRARIACGAGRHAALCAAGYRLPRNVLDREVEIIRRLGVQFVLNSRIGADISLADLEERFDAVFLSLGTWKETQVRLAGSDSPACSARCISWKAGPGRSGLGAGAVIIGGGNSAIDCARTAIRKGLSATVIYRRERKDMPAIAEEVDAAEEEGVKFVFLASPHRIVGEHGAVKAIEVTRTRLGAFDTRDVAVRSTPARCIVVPATP